MKTLRFDSTGGASGDMILGAFAGLGVDVRQLQSRLASLAIDRFEIRAQPVMEAGMSGIRVTVDVPHGHPEHRHLADIRQLIEDSDLPARVKDLSVRTFVRLAEAEAMVHATTPDKIHFHEVGAIDAIVDIVGSCLALDLLGVQAVQVGPLPAGHGTIESAHGVLPNPAPATVELLKAHPVTAVDEPFELVTPTGAALLMTWKQLLNATDADTGVIVAAANGWGQRRLSGRPNLLRAVLLETAAPVTTAVASPSARDECLVLECNLDDITPELVGAACQKFMDDGALDAFVTPVQMKKQRPGLLLTVLCKPVDRDRWVDAIFSETTTFGIREYVVQRSVLNRRHAEVQTPYGTVRIKVGSWKGRDITCSPEYDDCVECARKCKVPVRTVYEAAVRASPNPRSA